MRILSLVCAALLLCSSRMSANNKLDLKAVTDGSLSAQTISGITPIEGSDLYTQISSDGKRVVRYSFKTGKQTDVLFDIDDTQGEKLNRFDGYILSPDGKRMLIRTEKKAVYRRSHTAVYYIYTVASKKLERLSDGGPQQVPTWSPDGLQVAFVRDNNIFLVKLLYDNAESQVTTESKRGD